MAVCVEGKALVVSHETGDTALVFAWTLLNVYLSLFLDCLSGKIKNNHL